MEDDFFVILEKNDTRCFRHMNEAQALIEAKRLCSESPDKKFFILRAYKVAKVGPNVVIEDTDDIPF